MICNVGHRKEDNMKSILLTYSGLIAIAGGLFCALCGDPDALLLGVPLLIAGPILFIENLKKGIARAVAEEMADRGQ